MKTFLSFILSATILVGMQPARADFLGTVREAINLCNKDPFELSEVELQAYDLMVWTSGVLSYIDNFNASIDDTNYQKMYQTALEIRRYANKIASINRSDLDKNSPNYKVSVEKLRDALDGLANPVLFDKMKAILSQGETTAYQTGGFKSFLKELVGIKTAFAALPTPSLIIPTSPGVVPGMPGVVPGMPGVVPGVPGVVPGMPGVVPGVPRVPGVSPGIVVFPGIGPQEVPVASCFSTFGLKAGAGKLLALAVPGTREYMIGYAVTAAAYVSLKTADEACRYFSSCPEGTVKLDADTDILGATIHVCCPIGKEKVYVSKDGENYSCCAEGDGECFCRAQGPNYGFYKTTKGMPDNYATWGGYSASIVKGGMCCEGNDMECICYAKDMEAVDAVTSSGKKKKVCCKWEWKTDSNGTMTLSSQDLKKCACEASEDSWGNKRVWVVNQDTQKGTCCDKYDFDCQCRAKGVNYSYVGSWPNGGCCKYGEVWVPWEGDPK